MGEQTRTCSLLMSLYSSPYSTPKKSQNQSDMSISEISSPSKSALDPKHGHVLDQIHETKSHISILSAKTDVYAKNTTLTYKEYSTPIKRDPSDQSYKKSPYGKELSLPDYSLFV